MSSASGPENLGSLRANVAMQRGLGIDVELIGRDEAQCLWPDAEARRLRRVRLRAPGRLRRRAPDRAGLRRTRRVATASELRQDTAVVALEVAHGRGVGVRLADGGRVGATHVVLAAGPWSSPLAATAGVDLPVRAQRAQILLVDPGRPPGPLPCSRTWCRCSTYAPRGPASLLLGDSDHSDPEWADPDAYRERVSDDELAVAVPKFAHRFPGFDGASLSSSYAGCYDVTPDYNPVISSCPVEGLWLCAGFSGHGYKISPSVGELMADLIVTGSSRHPDVDHRDFRWERFARRGPDREPAPLPRRGPDALSRGVDGRSIACAGHEHLRRAGTPEGA